LAGQYPIHPSKERKENRLVSYLSNPSSFENASQFIEYCARNFQEVIPAEVAEYFPEFQLQKTRHRPRISPDQKIRINLLSSVCGSGKTWVICHAAMAVAREGGIALIIQETRELIAKTKAAMIRDGFNCAAVHGGTTETVIREILERIENVGPEGLILFITHAAFYCLPESFGNKSITSYFFDEAPNVVKHLYFNLPRTHHLITDYISVTDRDGIYGDVEVLDPELFKEMGINEDEDDVWNLFREVSWGLWNKNWGCVVNLEHYRKLERGEVGQLNLIFQIKPSVFEGFQRGSIAAAYLEDSYFYSLYEDNFDFATDPLSKKLRPNAHKNGHLNSFYYGFEAVCWSKKVQGKTLIEGDPTTNLERMVNGAKKLFGSNHHLWKANNCEGNLFDPNTSMRLPSKVEGRNDFDKYHNIVILSASNPTPVLCGYLRHEGLSDEQIQKGTQYKDLYQAALRTSARTDSLAPRIFVTPTRLDSEYLVERMGARCPPSWLRMDGFASAPILGKNGGRPRKPDSKSDSDRKKEERTRRKTAKAEVLSALRDLIVAKLNHVTEKGKRDSLTGFRDAIFSEYITDQPETFPIPQSSPGHPAQIGRPFAWVYPSTDSWQSKGKLLLSQSNQVFIERMERMHERTAAPEGEDDLCISTAIYEGLRRDRGSIQYHTHLCLDFENGHLSPKEFAKQFPDLQMAIFNSKGHSFGKDRFHVIILLKDIVTPDAYEWLWDRIALKLEDAGYWVGLRRGRPPKDMKLSGLDKGSRKPTQIYRLPCQAENGVDSFFDKYIDGREPLDAVKWIENDHHIPQAPRKPTEAQGEHSDAPPDLIAIDREMGAWSLLKTGERNLGLFKMFHALKRARIPRWQIDTIIDQAANMKFHDDNKADSPKDRLRHAKQLKALH
jgi:hypothetical protein